MLSLVLVALLAPAFAWSADTSAPNDWSVRNAIDDALEDIRTIIFNGDPGRGIPVLDPLTFGEWGFAVNEQPMLTAQASVSQVTFEGLGAFVSEQPAPPMGVVPPRIIVAVRVRLPALRAAGRYRLAGEVHTPRLNDSAIDAAGDFTMIVKDISVLVKVQITLNWKVKNVDVTLGLGDVFIDVQGAGKVGNIINDEAALRVQTWFAENRSQMELQLADTIKKGIQSHLDKESRTWSILG